MNNPVITLCVLAYNRPQDLENVIKSYLYQDFKNSEMVIFDDKSPTDLTLIVKKWIKKDKRIRFYRNKENLGLAKNFSESLKYCRGKYILTLGDDDLFIDETALRKYVEVFESDKEIGVIRSRQVILRNYKLYQVSAIGKKEVEVYDKGEESLDKFVIDTISMAGNAFRNDSILKLANKYSESIYLQVEIAMKILLFKKSAVINKYLIGVGSGENQLNVLTYKLNGKKTNILEDFNFLIDRVNGVAKSNKLKEINKNDFIKKLTNYLIILLPNDSLGNGKRSTLGFAKKMIEYNSPIVFRLVFVISLCIVFLPNLIIKKLLMLINKLKLNSNIEGGRILEINNNLSKVYSYGK